MIRDISAYRTIINSSLSEEVKDGGVILKLDNGNISSDLLKQKYLITSRMDCLKALIFQLIAIRGRNCLPLVQLFGNDEKFIERMVEYQATSLKFASNEIKKNKSIVIKALKKSGHAMVHVDHSLYSDREIALAAIENNAFAFNFIADYFSNDKEIIMKAVSKSGNLIYYANYYDLDIILEAIRTYELAFELADSKYHSDREVMLKAVQRNGICLKYASEELRKDRELVLEAVRKAGDALEFSLVQDREIVMEAVKSSGTALAFVQKQFLNDPQIIMNALQSNGASLQYLPKELKSVKEYVEAAITENPFSIKHASEEYKLDREIVKKVVSNKGKALDYVDKQFSSDKEIVFLAAVNNHTVLRNVDNSLRTDLEFLMEIAKVSKKSNALVFYIPPNGEDIGDYFSKVPYELVDKTIIREKIRYFGFKTTLKEFINDKKIMTDMITDHPQYMVDIQKSKDLLLQAICVNSELIGEMPFIIDEFDIQLIHQALILLLSSDDKEKELIYQTLLLIQHHPNEKNLDLQ